MKRRSYTAYNTFGLVVVLFIALIAILGLLILFGGISFNTFEKAGDVTGKIFGNIKYYNQKSQSIKPLSSDFELSCENTTSGAVIRNSTGKYSYKNICQENEALHYSCSGGTAVDAVIPCSGRCENGECISS